MSAPVILAAPGLLPAHHRVVESGLDFSATVDHLKAAIVASGFWLIAEIDPQMLLGRAGIAMPPARQLLFFHPRFMAQLLSTNPNGLPEAPLKFVVLVHADGLVRVHHPDPASAFAAHPGLVPLGAELAGMTRTVLADLPARQ